MIKYRPEIDGLRAIAILSVILFHAGSATFSGGYVGVDVFFVISGFLITSIILEAEEEGGFSYIDFYARRARRLLPALLVMTLVTTIAAIAVFLPIDLIEYGKLLIYTVLFGANFMLASTPGYFDHAMRENPLLHMWSLSVEEQFYLLWPTLLILTLQMLPRRKIVLAMFGLVAISLFASEALVHTWPRSAFFHLPSRGWELLAGAVIAMKLVPPVTSRIGAEALSTTGVILMIAPVFLYTEEAAFPGFAAIPPVLGCALVIHSNGTFRTKSAAILRWRPAVFIGLISYSLYLWHWPVFALPSYVLFRPLQPAESLICVLISVLLAILSWQYVERPFRKCLTLPQGWFAHHGQHRIPRLTSSGYFALALTAVLVASGSFFQESVGAPWRYSPEVRGLVAKPSFSQSARNSKSPRREPCVRDVSPRKLLIECQFGDESTDLILWGDSHAEHYLPAVAEIYRHGRGYFGPGCAPLIGAYWVTKAGQTINPACPSNNEYVLGEILKLKPKVVVIASRWSIIEEPLYSSERRARGYLAKGFSSKLTREGSRETFAEAISETVRRLTEDGIKIVLMAQAPEMLAPVQHCLGLSKSLGLPDERCGSVPREEAERPQFYVNLALDAVAKRYPNVFVFYPFNHMCDAARCYAIKDNQTLYGDNNHLNRQGALSLAEALDQELPKKFRLPDSSPLQFGEARPVSPTP